METILDIVSFIIGLFVLIFVLAGIFFVGWSILLLSYKLTVLFWSLVFGLNVGF